MSASPLTSRFDEFFQQVVGREVFPYPYQASLALNSWPDLLDVPTGLGKTAAVSVAWLFKRIQNDPATPRRLVWCLPTLISMKEATGRARDRDDAEHLREILAELERNGPEEA